jgi:hypothetical protein
MIINVDTLEGKQHSRRRLKGLLALLPETGSLYPFKHQSNQLICTGNGHSPSTGLKTFSTKVTSRKQLRRQLNRHRKEINLVNVASGSVDVESGNCSDHGNTQFVGREPEHPTSTTIYLSDVINENDVAVVFLFDPYQAYSLQLLDKLFTVCEVANNDDKIKTSNDTGNDNQGFPTYQSKLHCLVVTFCNDSALIDNLLENSGTVLISTDTGSPSAWKIAMGGASVCPSILAVMECKIGRNLFPINHEELALDWNTVVHVYNSWLHDHASAYSFFQRIKAYTLYPTSSSCIVQ